MNSASASARRTGVPWGCRAGAGGGYFLVGHLEVVLPVSCPRSGFVTLLSNGSSLQEEAGFNPARDTLQMSLSKPDGKWLKSQAKGCLSFPLGMMRAVDGVRALCLRGQVTLLLPH